MAKQKETLEEGLNREATKKGFTGKERQRYIGGTLSNLAKKGKIKLHRVPPPKRGKPVKPKEPITLIVKKNVRASESASSRGIKVDIYSIYNKKTGAMWSDGLFRKRAVATRRAFDEQDAYNNGLKQNRARF
jgi:hypothetical protein